MIDWLVSFCAGAGCGFIAAIVFIGFLYSGKKREKDEGAKYEKEIE